MSFVVHFNLPEFLKDINKGSTVYCAAYALKDKPTGTVLLTSDAGVPGGVIRAIQMTITGENPNALALAMDAASKVRAFLQSKEIIINLGVFATSGLQEALRYWAVVPSYSLTDVDEVLKQGEEVASK
jgi:hypothetical protein